MPARNLTHFLCIPLITESSRPQLERSLARFKGDVLGNPASQPFGAAAVRPVGTWHLTLGVMNLAHSEQLANAVKLLGDLDVVRTLAQIASPGTIDGDTETVPRAGAPELPQLKSGASARDTATRPLVISLTSLASMHEDDNTSILYAIPVDSTGRLQTFCQCIRDAFSTAGLLVPDDRPLRLHATVVNTVYAKPQASSARRGGHGPKAAGTKRFDARHVLAKCKEWKWAEDFRIEKVAICRMGANKIVEDGEAVDQRYEEIAGAKLP